MRQYMSANRRIWMRLSCAHGETVFCRAAPDPGLTCRVAIERFTQRLIRFRCG